MLVAYCACADIIITTLLILLFFVIIIIFIIITIFNIVEAHCHVVKLEMGQNSKQFPAFITASLYSASV